jgi:hypothetical protein
MDGRAERTLAAVRDDRVSAIRWLQMNDATSEGACSAWRWGIRSARGRGYLADLRRSLEPHAAVPQGRDLREQIDALGALREA